MDRETLKIACAFFRSCSRLVGWRLWWWWLGGNAEFTDQYGFGNTTNVTM